MQGFRGTVDFLPPGVNELSAVSLWPFGINLPAQYKLAYSMFGCRNNFAIAPHENKLLHNVTGNPDCNSMLFRDDCKNNKK